MIFIILAIIILVVSFAIAFVSLVGEQTKFEREINFQKEGEAAPVPRGEARVQPHEEQSQLVSAPDVQGSAVMGQAPDRLVTEATDDLQESYQPTRTEEPFPWLKSQQEGHLAQDPQDKRTIDKIEAEIARKVEENQAKRRQDETEYETSGRLSGEFSLAKHREADSGKS